MLYSCKDTKNQSYFNLFPNIKKEINILFTNYNSFNDITKNYSQNLQDKSWEYKRLISNLTDEIESFKLKITDLRFYEIVNTGVSSLPYNDPDDFSNLNMYYKTSSNSIYSINQAQNAILSPFSFFPSSFTLIFFD